MDDPDLGEVSDPSFREVFVEHVCAHQYPLQFVFAFALTFLLLMFGALAIAESGSATYVIATVNVASLVALLVVVGTLLLQCRELP